MTDKHSHPSDDYGSPWKDILERYFPEFMAFFFPNAYADIDWSRGYECLDKELQQIVRDAELGKRLADKLFKVWRRNGEAQIILIHIEVQGTRESGFEERMYVYHYRIFDRHRQPVVSLAVLGDDNPRWQPEHYGYELWGCCSGITFPVVKLLDYEPRWDELEASPNPFAIVVMAPLKTRATRNDANARYRWKLRLVKQLYERGYQREDILELFRFIDWLLTLPDELEQHFQDELEAYEAAMSTPYITSIERRGMEKGLQQVLEAERALLLRQIKRRFGEAYADAASKVLAQIDDPEQLADIGEWVVDCANGETLIVRVQDLLQ